jgi:butyryl-CoA dehydrogenase
VEEISRVSAALGLCVSVHNSVCVYPLMQFGTEKQKEKWIPPLARCEKIGAFCLTEPNAGSDAAGIEATALRDGDSYLINANKVFVTNGGVADTQRDFRNCRRAGYKGIRDR